MSNFVIVDFDKTMLRKNLIACQLAFLLPCLQASFLHAENSDLRGGFLTEDGSDSAATAPDDNYKHVTQEKKTPAQIITPESRASTQQQSSDQEFRGNDAKEGAPRSGNAESPWYQPASAQGKPSFVALIVSMSDGDVAKKSIEQFLSLEKNKGIQLGPIAMVGVDDVIARENKKAKDLEKQIVAQYQSLSKDEFLKKIRNRDMAAERRRAEAMKTQTGPEVDAIAMVNDARFSDSAQVTFGELYKRYQLKGSPTWIVRCGHKDYVYHGTSIIDSLFAQNGDFQEDRCEPSEQSFSGSPDKDAMNSFFAEPETVDFRGGGHFKPFSGQGVGGSKERVLILRRKPNYLPF